MTTKTAIRIPQSFYDDHAARGLPTPAIVRALAAHYYIASDDPALGELIDDARHYAHLDGPDNAPEGVRASARAMLRHIESAQKPGAGWPLVITTTEGR